MINVKKIMTKNKDKFRDFPINRIILIFMILKITQLVFMVDQKME